MLDKFRQRELLHEAEILELQTPSKEEALKYEAETLDHIRSVFTNISILLTELTVRGSLHDKSKTETPEKEMFAKYRKAMDNLTYGTPEYDKLKTVMSEDFLYKHYEQNKHHPEYYENGIKDMDLVDLTEMLCDWIAASQNNVDLNINQEKFKYDDVLKRILQNTIDRYFKK